MAEYKLYCLDRNGRIWRRHELVAANDGLALAAAGALAAGVTCELWSGTRKVALLPAGEDPVLSPPGTD